MADGDLSAVGKAGFQARTGLAVYDRYAAAGLGEIPGACDASEAGADDQNFHDALGKVLRMGRRIRRFSIEPAIINDESSRSGR